MEVETVRVQRVEQGLHPLLPKKILSSFFHDLSHTSRTKEKVQEKKYEKYVCTKPSIICTLKLRNRTNEMFLILQHLRVSDPALIAKRPLHFKMCRFKISKIKDHHYQCSTKKAVCYPCDRFPSLSINRKHDRHCGSGMLFILTVPKILYISRVSFLKYQLITYYILEHENGSSYHHCTISFAWVARPFVALVSNIRVDTPE